MSAVDGVHGTVCNAQQYEQSLPSLSNPDPSISCLTHGQTIGLAIAAEASFISILSVLILYILVGRNVLRYRKALPNGDWKLLRYPADIYMLSLFSFDFFQALGGALDVQWAHIGIVTPGSYCSAQGIIQQFGELGVALITLILTVHTFIAALWGVGREARMVAFGNVCLALGFVSLWVGLGNGLHKNYEAPTPFWCWINAQYDGERLAGEYVWLWFALFASLLMYIPLYFWAKGRLSVDEEKWYKLRLRNLDDKLGRPERREALRLLFYPLSYSIVVLPLSVARWSLFDHAHVSSATTFFSVTLFNLSGAINVTLLLVVRPRLLLFVPPKKISETGTELGHQCSTGSVVIPPSVPKYNVSLQPTAKDDLGERSWKPTSEGTRDKALPSISYTEKTDDT